MGTVRTEYGFSSTGAEKVARDYQQVGDAGERAFARIRTASREVPGHLKAVDAAAASLKTQVERAAGSLGTLGTAIAAIGGPIGLAATGLAAAGVALFAFTKRAIESADTLSDSAKAIGINVETLQEYQFAAVQAGIGQEKLEGSLRRFVKNVGEAQLGTGDLASKLKTMDAGLLANVTSAGSVEQALDLVFQKLAATRSETERAVIANAAFGRSGGQIAALAPMIARVREESRELGAVWSEELVGGADRAADAMDKLGLVASKNLQGLLLEAAPAIEAYVESWTRGALRIVGGLKEILHYLGLITESADDELGGVIETLNAKKGELERLRQGETGVAGTLSAFIDPANAAAERAAAIAALEAEIARLRERRVQLTANIQGEHELAAAKQQEHKDDAARLAADAKGLKDQERAQKTAAAATKQAAAERAQALQQIVALEDKAATAGLDGIEEIVAARDVELQHWLDTAEAKTLSEEETARGVVAIWNAAFAKIVQEDARAAEKHAEASARAVEKQAEQQARAAEKAADEMNRPFVNAIENIQRGFGDLFTQIFEDGTFTFKDLASTIRSIFARLAGELATLMIIRPILAPIAANFGAFGGFGGGVGAADLVRLGTGVTSLNSGIDTLGFGVDTLNLGVKGLTSGVTTLTGTLAGGIQVVGPGLIPAGEAAFTGAKIGVAGVGGTGLVGSFGGGLLGYGVGTVLEGTGLIPKHGALIIGGGGLLAGALAGGIAGFGAAGVAGAAGGALVGGLGGTIGGAAAGAIGGGAAAGGTAALGGVLAGLSATGIGAIVAAVIAIVMVALNAFGVFKPTTTGGTKIRQGFEKFLESEEGEVPFFAGRNDVIRVLGQAEARRFEKEGRGTFNEGQYADIAEKAATIGLSRRQQRVGTGLAVAYRAFFGGEAGLSETRVPGLIAELFGNIALKGLNAAEAMQVFGKAIQNLGEPSLVFKTINDFFLKPDTDITTEQYRDAVQGLSDAIFDVPAGVHPAVIALEELDKAMADGGKQGVVTFQQIEQRVKDVTAAANLLLPVFRTLTDALAENPSQFLVTGADGQQIVDDTAIALFHDQVLEAMRDATMRGFTQAILASTFNAQILEPFTARVSAAIETRQQLPLNATPEEIAAADTAAIAEINAATREAAVALDTLDPIIREIINSGVALDKIFRDLETSGGVLSAQQIRNATAFGFNQSVQAQILAITDPLAAERLALVQSQEQRRQAALDTGADLVELETLFGLERAALLEKQRDTELRELEQLENQKEQIYERHRQAVERTLSQIDTYITSLTAGPQSPLAPQVVLPEAQERFATLLAQAQGGNLEAAGQLPQAAQDLLAVARTLFASTPEFFAIFDQVTAGLRDVLGEGAGAFQLSPGDAAIVSSIEAQTKDLLAALAKIESGGTAFPTGPGQFGLTFTGQANVQGALAGLSPSGTTIQTLRDIRDTGFLEMEAQGLQSTWTSQLRALFPSAKSDADFGAILDALIAKIEAPGTFQPILGFATGGLVTGPTRAILGEFGAEAILPLTDPRAMAAIQRALAGVVQPLNSASAVVSVLDRVFTPLAQMPAMMARAETGGATRDLALLGELRGVNMTLLDVGRQLTRTYAMESEELRAIRRELAALRAEMATVQAQTTRLLGAPVRRA